MTVFMYKAYPVVLPVFDVSDPLPPSRFSQVQTGILSPCSTGDKCVLVDKYLYCKMPLQYFDSESRNMFPPPDINSHNHAAST